MGRNPTVLIGRAEAARRVGLHPKSWDLHWKRVETLVNALVVVRVRPGGRGVYRWAEDVIEEHIRGLMV